MIAESIGSVLPEALRPRREGAPLPFDQTALAVETISEADSDCDPDSDPDNEGSSRLTVALEP